MEIVDELERRGTRCWIAPRDVRPGEPFDDEIADAIDACRGMVLIFSDLCNDSEYIRREVTVAGESHKSVIPFRIEDVQPRRGLRVRLSDLHWIDGFVSRERAIDELIKKFPPSAKGSSGDAPAARQQAEAKGLAVEQERQPLESGAAASREAEERARQAAVAEAESQRRERDAAAARQAEGQRIAEEQRQQAEAERLAQEEKDRVRAAETSPLAGKETQNKEAASEAAAPSGKAALGLTLTIGALVMIAAIVAIAVLLVGVPRSDNFPSCFESDASAEVAACTQEIALHPKDEWAHSNRCSAYLQLGNYNAAIADCNQAIALDDGQNWTAYYNRGLSYEKLGIKAAAIADYQKALSMHPSSQITQYSQDALKRLGASPAAPGGR